MSKKPRAATLFFLLVAILVSLAFASSTDNTVGSDTKVGAQNDLIQQELARKLAEFKEKILVKCRQAAIDDAEIYIDSLVAEELRLQASDTLFFPSRPDRPVLAQPVILNDSTEIAPIIK